MPIDRSVLFVALIHPIPCSLEMLPPVGHVWLIIFGGRHRPWAVWSGANGDFCLVGLCFFTSFVIAFCG